MNEIPSSLKQAVRDKTLVPFVGLGVSLSLLENHFPTWTQLLEKLNRTLEDEAETAKSQIVQGLLTENRLFEAAAECLTGLGKRKFYEVVRSAIDLPIDVSCDLTTPKKIWALKPNLIITTNYDKVLERSFSSSKKLLNHQTPEIANLPNGLSYESPTVWHIHGHVDDLNSLILAPSQYESLYPIGQGISHSSAYQKLLQIVSDRPLLFVGFGLSDDYVMNMLKYVFAIFEGNLDNSYALMKKGFSAKNVWEEQGIRVVEYDDHGEPLNDLLSRLANEVEKRKESVIARAPSNFNGDIPGCKFTTRETEHSTSLQQLLEVLVDEFSFRWELENFQFENGEQPIVFWPVRLRQPMAIHAVQTFAIALLQQVGLEIYLCLDDFGEKKGEPGRFRNSVDKWLRKAGGDPAKLNHELFSTIMKTKEKKVAWQRATDWLGKGKHNVGEVFDICKIAKAGIASEATSLRGTGRLLTPATVWSCLEALHKRHEKASLITFGGFDERSLWDSWKRCVDVERLEVGHLYIPELSDVHMQTTDLTWSSKLSIEETLRVKCEEEAAAGDWQTVNSFIPWTLSGCVLLPKFGSCKQVNVTSFEIEASADPMKMVSPLAKMVERWLV